MAETANGGAPTVRFRAMRGDEAEENADRERAERRRRLAPPAPEALRDPEDHQSAEGHHQLAAEHAERKRRAREQPRARPGVGTAREREEEEQRDRNRDAVAEEERLVQEERPVHRGAEPRERRHHGAEVALREKEDQRDVQDAERELAETQGEVSVADDGAHRRERVRIERRLVVHGAPAAPARPGLGRGGLLHPRRIGVVGVATEDVTGEDVVRPAPVGQHVALGPGALVLAHRLPRHPEEVRQADACGNGKDEEQDGGPLRAGHGRIRGVCTRRPDSSI